MLRNAFLFVLLLSSFIFGQDTSFWKPYITEFQGKDVTKIDFNYDSTKLYIWSVNSLYSNDLSSQKTTNLLTVQSINDFFVNDSSIYISTNLNYSTKIRVSNNEGITWKDIPVPNAFYGFYVKSHQIYVSRYHIREQSPPDIYGIWRTDSLGNNLTMITDANMGRVNWIAGIVNGSIYFYYYNGALGNPYGFYVFTNSYPKLIIDYQNQVFFNENNGDTYYKARFITNDTIYKAKSNEKFILPFLENMFFFDTTNVLAATEKGFYLKTSEMNSFVKIINSNPAHVKYMIKDKENYIYLATTKGIFKSSLPFDKTGMLSNNENELELKGFSLSNNYPNPFNPSTIINFTVDQPKHIKLKVFDLLGKEVKVLVDEFKSAGSYDVDFNAADLPSGVYIYSLTDGKNIISKKMTLIK